MIKKSLRRRKNIKEEKESLITFICKNKKKYIILNEIVLKLF